MFRPDDPLAPRAPHFEESWHAQALALADTMVSSGQIPATDWAQALGQSLRTAETAGAPDTDDTYYKAVVTALETLTTSRTNISPSQIAERKAAWETAYKSTPHGQPVRLPDDATPGD